MRKSRVRLGPHLVAQTSPNPASSEYRFFKIAGVIFLIAAAVFVYKSFDREKPTETSSLPESEAVLGAQTTTETDGLYSYTVLEGETLFSISSKFEVSWQEIADLNNLKEPYSLTAGQKLILPENQVLEQQKFLEDLKNKRYVVQQGDTFVGIAQKLDLSVTELLRANPELDSLDVLRIGQVLNLP